MVDSGSEKESKIKAEEKKGIDWLEEEDVSVGGLSIDVYEDSDYLVVKSTIAGVKPEDIEVIVDGEMLLIKGKRSREETVSKESYYYQECYWGGFERSLKLPVQVEPHGIEARLSGGILSIRLRKARKAEKMSVKVKAD